MDKYHSRVETNEDALQFVKAYQSKGFPLVDKLLAMKERPSISSGSVFVYAVEETRFKRWNDGRAWSSSLARTGFLMYHEVERRPDQRFRANRRGGGKTSYSNRGLHKSQGAAKQKSLPLKKDGLVKRVFTVDADGKHFKVISYYSQSQDGRSEPQRSRNDPNLQVLPSTKATEPDLPINGARSIPATTQTPIQQPTPVPSQTVQEFDDLYGQPGYSRDALLTAHRSNTSDISPHSPCNLPNQTFYASSPTFYTETPPSEQSDILAALWNEYSGDHIPLGAQGYSHEQHPNSVAHGAGSPTFYTEMPPSEQSDILAALWNEYSGDHIPLGAQGYPHEQHPNSVAHGASSLYL